MTRSLGVLVITALLVAACGGSGPPTQRDPRGSVAGGAADAALTTSQSSADPSPPAPADAGLAPIVLPTTWTSCRHGTDCTVVGLGCCELTAVNRAHEADGRRMLSDSGREYCPIKAPCPVPPLRCVSHVCTLQGP